ncbi:MAG TPA: glucose-6-phosphate isomerase, partial [Candidatus Binatia bacterium]|nr:glucose-6-phosphate isomerase [Candidatus Binatia bacterium]
HYWLRNSKLAPTTEIRAEIENTIAAVKKFAADVHSGKIRGSGGTFSQLLLIGIGGSALGPQFVSHALGHPKTDKIRLFFFDNTDPDGMDRVLDQLDGSLGRTLCLVISKSGGTKETRNGMLEAKVAYEKAGLRFSDHTVAITGVESALDKLAQSEKWLARFPMWDWVGGRTSETSAVGLLPAALQGIDIDQFLAGAAACDEITRRHDIKANPAAQLALAWHYATDGRGRKDMVVLPYKDRLELFSRYLQQLVMESLGKERDLGGNIVNQGLTVYGNKGSTDQHAYVQQLREGIPNFFVVFIQALQDRTRSAELEVEPQITSGDYLLGFLVGTQAALFENGRQSLTLTLTGVSAQSVGSLIALFERAVGLYAVTVNVNAYHQPGVEAGKKAAESVIALQQRVLSHIKGRKSESAREIAATLNGDPETVFKICQHLAANGRLVREEASNPFDARYRSM